MAKATIKTRKKSPPAMPADRFAIEAARLAADRHCTDVLLLDLRNLSPVCDYFLIATGTSDRQMRSVGMEIVDLGEANDNRAFSSAGLEASTWVLLDFVDLIVHLFSAEARDFYALEMLWGDAPQIDCTK